MKKTYPLLAAALTVLALTGCVSAATGATRPEPTPASTVDATSPAPATTAAPTPSATENAAASSVVDLLNTLPVKGRAPKTGYSRDQFGNGWKDPDRNGCDARNDILARDMADEITSGPCKVLSGTIHDPYTGKTIGFVRGNDTSMAVQIDHRVALSNAWQTGAQQLTAEQRVELANDPMNLIAVDGPTNGQKSDGDAATWLPPQRGYRCEYVAAQVQVKAKYRLWVTQPEKDAMLRILADCSPATVDPGTPVPVETQPPAVVEQPATEQGAVFYANCDAVRAAGAAPIRTGDPGYTRKLDRDGDGVACE
ncbi:DUF1524 domain-containing protein [Agromyces sp. NPDC057679]|uniref:GmrSD restriction endonuclease domain-containing protein n=1 Tax=Agromyces sp. NPDC057679 TaxID=3346207 RepID=UPI003672B05B